MTCLIPILYDPSCSQFHKSSIFFIVYHFIRLNKLRSAVSLSPLCWGKIHIKFTKWLPLLSAQFSDIQYAHTDVPPSPPFPLQRALTFPKGHVPLNSPSPAPGIALLPPVSLTLPLWAPPSREWDPSLSWWDWRVPLSTASSGPSTLRCGRLPRPGGLGRPPGLVCSRARGHWAAVNVVDERLPA